MKMKPMLHTAFSLSILCAGGTLGMRAAAEAVPAPALAPNLLWQATTNLQSGQPLHEIPAIRSWQRKLRASLDMVSAGVSANPIRYGDVDLYSSNAPFPNASEPPPNHQQPFTMANAYRITAYGREYPASFPAPTFELKHGDTLDLLIRDELAGNIGHASDSLFETNFHSHGFHVNPLSMGDNVYPSINDPATPQEPGTMRIQIPIPAAQESGLNWFHVHHHTQTHPQVYGGLAGFLVVGNPMDPWPKYKAHGSRPLRQLNLALSEVNIQKTDAEGKAYEPNGINRLLRYGGTTAGTGNPDPMKNWQKRVNGQLNPVIGFRPGQTQVWNLASVGALGSFNLAVTDGNLQNPWAASLLVLDGNASNVKPLDMWLTANPERMNDLDSNTLLMPGNRMTMALTAPGTPGTYYLIDGWGGNNKPESGTFYVLATLQVSGTPVSASAPVFPPKGRDYSLFDTPADVKRRFEFFIQPDSMAGPNSPFLINGKVFGEADMPQLQIGTVEEWTLVNVTTQDGTGNAQQANHPFHIHQGNFIVSAVNGVPVDPRAISAQNSLNYISPRDTINVPINGSVTIKFRVEDFPGKYVFHCHILKHEDQGMMSPVLAFGSAEGLRSAFGDSAAAGDGLARVIDGYGQLIASRYPFGRGHTGGIVSTAALGAAKYYSTYALGMATGGFDVVVFSGRTNRRIGEFQAFEDLEGRTGKGVSLALGDITGDGLPEVIAGARRNGIPEIRIFTSDGKLLRTYSGFTDGEFPTGVNVASGDLDGDNFDDVIIGAGAGHDPVVMALSGRDIANKVPKPKTLFSFTAGGGPNAGARVAVGYVAPATRPSYLANLVTTPETGSGAGTVQVWNVYGLLATGMAMVMSGNDFPGSLQLLTSYQPFTGQTAPLDLASGYLGQPGVPQIFAWNKPDQIAATSLDSSNQPSTRILTFGNTVATNR